MKEKKRKRSKTPPLTPEQRTDKNQRERMKDRAGILSIEQIDTLDFRVWGGKSEHILRIRNGVVYCDCDGWANARHHNCSHVMKWRLVYGDLKRK